MSRSCPIFDAHFHVIDPEFPLIPNQGYFPDPFTVDDYIARVKGYDLVGGAVVSGSFQGFDQTYLVSSLRRLGSGFFGVTQAPATISDEDLIELHDEGVRAVRFNLRRGGSESIENLGSMASRVYELLGWHVELYVDSRSLGELCGVIGGLPSVSIDHLGLSREGFEAVLGLVERGVKIKATGFSRVNFPIVDALKRIHEINPKSLMFGTDLPSTRAPKPYSHQDLQLIFDHFSGADLDNILYKNAQEFYGCDPKGGRDVDLNT